MIEQKELLNQSFQKFEWALSGNGYFKINKKIKYKVRKLEQDYDIERDEILNNAFENLLDKKHYEKYDSEKSLSTFTIHYTNYNLNIQIRKQRNEKKNYPKISLNSLGEKTPDGYCGSSISFLEKLGADGLVDYTTPEDLVIAKELLEIIINHFSENDARVLLGYIDRRTEAERLSISYDAYNKRLQRKISAFLPVLKEAGYC
jgi:hypothetical protein